MNADLARGAATSAPAPIRRVRHGVACFAVGGFAGALASFFPRLMTILSGDPTQRVQVFSHEYLLVGAIVATVVGVVMVIVDGGPERKMRDVFMTALGIPTLLMGALTTGATTGNIAQLQSELTHATSALQAKADVPTRGNDASVPLPGPISSWQPLDLLMPSALAQTTEPELNARSSAQNSLGVTSRQPEYFVVYGSATSRADLKSIERAVNARGIGTKIVPGSKGDFLLVPAEKAVKPYSDAVMSAIRAQEAGAKPYIVRIP